MEHSQEFAVGQDVDAVYAAVVGFGADDVGGAGGEFAGEGAHGAQVALPHAGLGFDGDFAAAQDEIDFESAFGAPELDGMVFFLVAAGGDEFEQDEVLEGAAEFRATRVVQRAPADMAGHADIEQVELRRRGDALAPLGAVEWIDAVADKRVMQDVEIRFHGFGVHGAIAADRRVIEQFPVAETQGVEEADEGIGVARGRGFPRAGRGGRSGKSFRRS